MKEYIVCPLCGRNRVVESKKGPVRWDYVDLHTAPILQIREDEGGRGAGFPMVDSKTLPEILEDPAYAAIFEGLRLQLIRIVRDGFELGLLKEGDV